MITFIVCSHDEDTDLEGVLNDPRLLETCHKANYEIRVIPKPSNSFFRRNFIEPLLKNGYIPEEDFDKIYIYEKDGLHIDYRFVNEVREELKGIEFENNEEFYCQHIDEEYVTEGCVGIGTVFCCRLTHCACISKPSECLYYKIYEEAYDQGFSDGKLGEDL